MAVVAQLVEPRVVISVVVGSSPISRPNFIRFYLLYLPSKNLFLLKTLAYFGNFLRLFFVSFFCIYSSFTLSAADNL